MLISDEEFLALRDRVAKLEAWWERHTEPRPEVDISGVVYWPIRGPDGKVVHPVQFTSALPVQKADPEEASPNV